MAGSGVIFNSIFAFISSILLLRTFSSFVLAEYFYVISVALIVDGIIGIKGWQIMGVFSKEELQINASARFLLVVEICLKIIAVFFCFLVGTFYGESIRYLFVAIGIIFLNFEMVNGVYRRDARFKSISFFYLVQGLVKFLLLLLAYNLNMDFTKYVSINAVIVVVLSVIYIYYLFSTTNIDRTESVKYTEIFRFLAPVYLDNTVKSFVRNIDILILTSFSTDGLVVAYRTSKDINGLIPKIWDSINQVDARKIGIFIKNKSYALWRKMVGKNFQSVLILASFGLPLYFLIGKYILILLYPEYYEGIFSILWIFILVSIVQISSIYFHTTLLLMRLPKAILKFSITSLIVQLVVSFVCFRFNAPNYLAFSLVLSNIWLAVHSYFYISHVWNRTGI